MSEHAKHLTPFVASKKGHNDAVHQHGECGIPPREKQFRGEGTSLKAEDEYREKQGRGVKTTTTARHDRRKRKLQDTPKKGAVRARQ